jgi:hypothetical protein
VAWPGDILKKPRGTPTLGVTVSSSTRFNGSDDHRDRRHGTTTQAIKSDPEMIPYLDIAAKVGKDLFLDEKIPRHESGQGYVRVVEHSVLWKEKEASKASPYQGLTTCTEVPRRPDNIPVRNDISVRKKN